MTDIRTMQARVIRSGGASHYFYFPDVSIKRAAELAALNASAQCVPVERIEIRDDIYSNPYTYPPLLVADAEGIPTLIGAAHVFG